MNNDAMVDKGAYLPNVVAVRESQQKRAADTQESPVRKLSREETIEWMHFFDRPGV